MTRYNTDWPGNPAIALQDYIVVFWRFFFCDTYICTFWLDATFFLFTASSFSNWMFDISSRFLFFISESEKWHKRQIQDNATVTDISRINYSKNHEDLILLDEFTISIRQLAETALQDQSWMFWQKYYTQFLLLIVPINSMYSLHEVSWAWIGHWLYNSSTTDPKLFWTDYTKWKTMRELFPHSELH